MKKTLLILANSIKKGGRCVAGIEITNSDLDNPVFGEWIRPIDGTQEEGTLRTMTAYVSGKILRPLNIVEIEFASKSDDPNHPEDWIIETTPWKYLGSYDDDILSSLPQSSVDQWGSEKSVAAGSQGATLQLVKLNKSAKVNAGHFYNSFTGRDQFKTTIHIPSGRFGYDCSITDPFFTAAHSFSPNSITQDQAKQVTLSTGTYIVMSLTPPFTPQNSDVAKQYKIVASVFEPNA